MRDRYLNRDRLQHLDPVADCHEVYRTTALLEFPWDVQRALELALYRTFAIPTIASLLDDTGEFRLRAQRRYDDTGLLLITVVDSGPDSPAGRAAISRINRLHARFAISNDDFLYTLGTFVFV
ncbi:MAG: oxygenase MpaB family protein, partial [Mycobacteriales bacterium]